MRSGRTHLIAIGRREHHMGQPHTEGKANCEVERYNSPNLIASRERRESRVAVI